jgi:hypothetical protein
MEDVTMGYKLLTQDMKTRKWQTNEMDWSDVGVWHEATGEHGQGLCSDEYLHDYDDLLLAVFMNPVHSNINLPVCYETERDGDTETDGVKRGSRRLRLVRKVELPHVTDEQRVRFAILCAKEVCEDKQWLKWADKWLSSKSRSYRNAHAASVEYKELIIQMDVDCTATEYAARSAVYYALVAAGLLEDVSSVSSSVDSYVGYAASYAANASIAIDFVAIAHKSVSE